MFFGKPFNYDSIKGKQVKWFAWYPIRLNTDYRNIAPRGSDGRFKHETLKDYGRWVWLETVYKNFGHMSMDTFKIYYQYSMLPDYDHPDFKEKESNILRLKIKGK